jgi:hypothetical protein
MLINLSNHPSTHWNTTQINAAAVFGPIADVAFPQVPPLASAAQVAEMAQEFLNQLLHDFPDANNAFHIMGELSFTYALVRLLQQHQRRCLVSTTHRSVSEVNGVKTSTFEFQQFRSFPVMG